MKVQHSAQAFSLTHQLLCNKKQQNHLQCSLLAKKSKRRESRVGGVFVQTTRLARLARIDTQNCSSESMRRDTAFGCQTWMTYLPKTSVPPNAKREFGFTPSPFLLHNTVKGKPRRASHQHALPLRSKPSLRPKRLR